MTFGETLIALQDGKKVAREGWNGKNMFLILNGGYTVLNKDARPGHLDESFLNSQGVSSLNICPHIDMWTAQKELSVGWRPTNVDMFTNDWKIID